MGYTIVSRCPHCQMLTWIIHPSAFLTNRSWGPELRTLEKKFLALYFSDRKQNNVLLDADYTARLADFGYASLVGNIPEALTYLQRSTARPGALRWIAPEQIDPEETFNRTTNTDIYSFGCVALQASLFYTSASAGSANIIAGVVW